MRKGKHEICELCGVISNSPYFLHEHVTHLEQCELCLRYSVPKKIFYRSDIWGWDHKGKKWWMGDPSKATLCWSCYNKVKPIYKKKQNYNECVKLLNKLKRVIRDERKKHQEHRAT